VIEPAAEAAREPVGGIGLMLAAIAGMAVIGVLAWRAVQRQERGDAALEAKLKADDERAAEGRRLDGTGNG